MKRGPTCRTACPPCGLSFSICDKGTASEMGAEGSLFSFKVQESALER